MTSFWNVEEILIFQIAHNHGVPIDSQENTFFSQPDKWILQIDLGTSTFESAKETDGQVCNDTIRQDTTHRTRRTLAFLEG